MVGFVWSGLDTGIRPAGGFLVPSWSFGGCSRDFVGLARWRYFTIRLGRTFLAKYCILS